MYDETKTSDIIGKFYFRVSTDKINHARQVYRFMDWLGDVGGIGGVIEFGIMLLFSGFLEFNFKVSTIESLYSVQACKFGNEDESPSESSIELPDIELPDFLSFEGGYGDEGGGDDEILNVENVRALKNSISIKKKMTGRENGVGQAGGEGAEGFDIKELICDIELNIF